MNVFPARGAGVCLHLTCVPGERGIGELGRHARRFVDSLTAMGLGVWQVLPTGPTGYGNSPYQSVSVFAGNPLLIDLEALHAEGLCTGGELAAFGSLPRDTVDFGKLIPLKTRLLARAAERFDASAPPAQRAARDAFVAAHDGTWLHDYALFAVLKSLHSGRAWTEWDPPYAARERGALRAMEDAGRTRIEGEKTLQFLFFRQWSRLRAYAADKGIRLMGDVPIYVALDSADAWARPELLCLDPHGMPTAVAGVPPDYFSAEGQRWGNPLYRWERHAADGYAWWISRLRHTLTLFDMVRLDHFRGFEAYWAVPAEAQTARDGEWRPGPGAALFDALQESIGSLPIVAEDLGVITPEVEALRDRYRLPGMKVLQFMAGEDRFDPAAIPRACVCYTGTHDNDTTVGWFRGGPGDVRTAEEVQRTRENVLRHTGGRAETIHEDLVRLAFSTEAALAMAPMQDYLGQDSSARMNTPGTVVGNWTWRLRAEQITPAVSEWVRRTVLDSGRM